MAETEAYEGEKIQYVPTLYRFRRTGQLRRITPWHADPIELVEVELVSTAEDISDYDAMDAVARVEGICEAYYLVRGEFYYDSEAQGGQAIYLVREKVSVDAGDNIVRRRVAPQTTKGIAAPTLPGKSLNTICDDPVYAVKPTGKWRSG